MSELAAAQIPKPTDEQAFERASEILWRCILGDTGFTLYGRRGREQYGVDLVGFEGGDPDILVGVQCKLKSDHRKLTKNEVRDEVEKALNFQPPLSKYKVVTTAPDDPELGALALSLTQEISRRRSKPFRVEVLGWASLEREIRRYPEALNAFDPSHTAFGDRLLAESRAQTDLLRDELLPLVRAMSSGAQIVNPQSLSDDSAITSQLDAEIDRYAKLVFTDPSTAFSLFESLEAGLKEPTSGRIRFRVRANLAACQLELGNIDRAIAGFHEAFEFDPTNPKAVANKGAAYLLANELNELKRFAAEQLAKDPQNAPLAGHLVQGLIQDKAIQNPLEDIPRELQDSKEVTIAMVRWHSERSASDQWFAAAREAFERFGDEQDLAELYATSIINMVIGDRGLVYGRRLDRAEIALCEQAREILLDRWSTVKDPANHVRGEPISVPLNLSLLHRILGYGDDAQMVAEEALKRFPGNDEVRVRAAAIYSEAGQQERAFELVETLPLGKLTAQIRFSAALSLKNWKEVVNLADQYIDIFPEQDKTPVRAASLVAQVYLSKADERTTILNNGVEEFKSDTRAAVMLSRAADRFGLESLSASFFNMAVEAFEGYQENYAARITLAREAFDRAEWSLAVDLLFDHVDRSVDSEELRLLTNALCNEYPVRERGVTFFNTMSDNIISDSYFIHAKGISLSNQGRNAEARVAFRAAFEKRATLSDFLFLAQSHLINDDRAAVQELLSKHNPLELPGSPIDKVNICHLLAAFGHYDNVMEHAYAAICISPDNPEVAMRFCGLVINPTHNWSETEINTAGTWIKLEDENGAKFEAIIDEKVDRLWGKHISSENRFIRAFEARSPDGTFEFETKFGIVEKWKLIESKPNWLQAFHYLSENYQRLFPDHAGIGSINMKDGDVQPALEMVRRASEEATRRARLHIDSGMPLTFIAGRQSGGAIAIADHLTHIGERLRTCIGSQEERDHALMLIRKNSKRGAVVDALTAWRAAELGLLDVLSSQLGDLLIPQSELDVIKQILSDREMAADGESMTITYRDGEFFRDVKCAEERASQTQWIEKTVREIETKCKAMPVVFPNELPGGASDLLKMPNVVGLAPAALAGSEHLLLSDDMTFRQFAAGTFKTQGVWLQAVLIEARRGERISEEKYLDAVVMLAAYRHDNVSISSSDLIGVYSRDRSGNLVELRALCEFVGGRDADPISHLRLSASFINWVWAQSKWGDVKHQKATAIMLDALILRFRGEKWSLWAAYLVVLLSHDANAYVRRWVEGHFLPSHEVQSAIDLIAEVNEGQRSLDP